MCLNSKYSKLWWFVILFSNYVCMCGYVFFWFNFIFIFFSENVKIISFEIKFKLWILEARKKESKKAFYFTKLFLEIIWHEMKKKQTHEDGIFAVNASAENVGILFLIITITPAICIYTFIYLYFIQMHAYDMRSR